MNNTTSTLGELRARDDTAHIQVRNLKGCIWWWLDDLCDLADDTLFVYRLVPCPTCGAKP